jgi:excisionase family DNA binding protein
MKRPRLFTAKEAAALLGMSHTAFNDWVRRHGVPFVLVGNSRRFSKDTIDAIRAERAKRGLK